MLHIICVVHFERKLRLFIYLTPIISGQRILNKFLIPVDETVICEGMDFRVEDYKF